MEKFRENEIVSFEYLSPRVSVLMVFTEDELKDVDVLEMDKVKNEWDNDGSVKIVKSKYDENSDRNLIIFERDEILEKD